MLRKGNLSEMPVETLLKNISKQRYEVAIREISDFDSKIYRGTVLIEFIGVSPPNVQDVYEVRLLYSIYTSSDTVLRQVAFT